MSAYVGAVAVADADAVPFIIRSSSLAGVSRRTGEPATSSTSNPLLYRARAGYSASSSSYRQDLNTCCAAVQEHDDDVKVAAPFPDLVDV
jgi:hypothetical protein